MKVLVVGEAPSRWMQERGITDALPIAGKELAAMAGITWPGRWFELFEPVNVLGSWPGKQGKGDAFPLDLAIPAMRELVEEFHLYTRVVLLGRRVEMAYNGAVGRRLSHQEPLFHGFDARIAVAPHPSHVNRWWNSIENRAAASRFWMDVARQGVVA